MNEYNINKPYRKPNLKLQVRRRWPNTERRTSLEAGSISENDMAKKINFEIPIPTLLPSDEKYI